MSYDFANATSGAYPITAVTYQIVCSVSSNATKQALIKSFLSYGVTTGQAAADANGYAPLLASIVARDKTAIAALS